MTVDTVVYSVHVTTVLISITGFLLRGILLFSGSPLISRRWLKVVPHVNDTLLLASAITLAVMRGFNPVQQPWLMAKIIGLLIYIVLGLIAFRFGRSRGQRMLAWLAALAVFAYIVGLAVTKQPGLGL